MQNIGEHKIIVILPIINDVSIVEILPNIDNSKNEMNIVNKTEEMNRKKEKTKYETKIFIIVVCLLALVFAFFVSCDPSHKFLCPLYEYHEASVESYVSTKKNCTCYWRGSFDCISNYTCYALDIVFKYDNTSCQSIHLYDTNINNYVFGDVSNVPIIVSKSTKKCEYYDYRGSTGCLIFLVIFILFLSFLPSKYF